ncbi:MAG: type I restriction-modification system subunit M [Planctomycetota bacterium]|nr:type I restriction-modification system subunit M [Planctomycetota bacterium]
MNDPKTIVAKLWSFCNTLRDAGLSYGDYVEQLTFLLFLKMAHERTQAPYNEKSIIPKQYDWDSLRRLDGDALEAHYRHVLTELGKGTGLVATIFRRAQNKIQEPAMLRRLIVDLIDKEQWVRIDADVKGDAYEGLLQKNAEDVKGGAGQYFTPRPLIQAIVDCMAPGPKERICDPAAGTGGFLLAAYDYVNKSGRYQLDKGEKRHWKLKALSGFELVPETARLCVMNLVLHGIAGDESPIEVDDALRSTPKDHYSMVLTNPPFGRKSSIKMIGAGGEEVKEDLEYKREDFWATTKNKQLNFVQHVFSLLEQNGRAAVVVPDNVLFEGGAGERVRQNLLRQADVHTLLRLPTGVFYAQGVKANVLFFDRKPASETPWTKQLWIYDLRTNKHFTLKDNPLRRADLDEFVELFKPGARQDRKATWSEKQPEGRWRAYSYDELSKRDKTNLDIFWLRDESLEDADDLPEPDAIAAEILEDLEAAVEQIKEITADLEG